MTGQVYDTDQLYDEQILDFQQAVEAALAKDSDDTVFGACRCDESPHLNALHDVAADAVQIVAELIAARAKVDVITELVRPAPDEDSARSRREIVDEIWRIVGMPS